MMMSFVPLRLLMMVLASLMMVGMFPGFSDAGCHRNKGRRGGILREFRAARVLNQAGTCNQQYATNSVATEPVYSQPVNLQPIPAPAPHRTATVQFEPICPVCPTPGK